MTWYLSYEGQQTGPLSDHEARSRAAANPDGHAWRDGMVAWQPIASLPELRDGAPPPPPRPAGLRSDEIDYRIHGGEMQFVSVELDPNESVVAEAGALMFKAPSIQMETVFGTAAPDQGGLFQKLLGAGKRLLSGESMFTTVFTQTGRGKAQVAFAAPYPGNIIPVDLRAVGGTLVCQKDSFLCAAKGVSIGIFFQRKILTGLFGGDGFIMQKLEGDGMAFIHAGGTVLERDLAPGEVLHVDTGCVVGFTGATFDVQTVGNIKSALFGGEGIFLAVLTGPGKVWVQSLPFSRLAGRMLMARPGSHGEGAAVSFLSGSWGSDSPGDSGSDSQGD